MFYSLHVASNFTDTGGEVGEVSCSRTQQLKDKWGSNHHVWLRLTIDCTKRWREMKPKYLNLPPVDEYFKGHKAPTSIWNPWFTIQFLVPTVCSSPSKPKIRARYVFSRHWGCTSISAQHRYWPICTLLTGIGLSAQKAAFADSSGRW